MVKPDDGEPHRVIRGELDRPAALELASLVVAAEVVRQAEIPVRDVAGVVETDGLQPELERAVEGVILFGPFVATVVVFLRVNVSQPGEAIGVAGLRLDSLFETIPGQGVVL